VPDIVIQAETPGKHDTIGHQAENGRAVALRAQGRALRDPARGVCAKVWYHRDDDKVKDPRGKGITLSRDKNQ
jgi:hypothetical protein